MKKLLKRLKVLLLTTFKYKFKSYGENFYFGSGLFVRPNSVHIGNNVYIGRNSHLSVKEIIIQDYVMLASNVSVVGGDHSFKIPGIPIRESGRDEEKKVVIKRDSWIGHGAILLHGITVGEGAIVAAGSVVTKDVEAYSIVAGSPAKKIKMRFSDDEIEEHKKKLNFN